MLSQKCKRKLGCVAWLAMLCLTLTAQPDHPNAGRRPAEKVPIGGIEWLLVAGGLWGASKLTTRKR